MEEKSVSQCQLHAPERRKGKETEIETDTWKMYLGHAGSTRTKCYLQLQWLCKLCLPKKTSPDRALISFSPYQWTDQHIHFMVNMKIIYNKELKTAKSPYILQLLKHSCKQCISATGTVIKANTLAICILSCYGWKIPCLSNVIETNRK